MDNFDLIVTALAVFVLCTCVVLMLSKVVKQSSKCREVSYCMLCEGLWVRNVDIGLVDPRGVGY